MGDGVDTRRAQIFLSHASGSRLLTSGLSTRLLANRSYAQGALNLTTFSLLANSIQPFSIRNMGGLAKANVMGAYTMQADSSVHVKDNTAARAIRSPAGRPCSITDVVRALRPEMGSTAGWIPRSTSVVQMLADRGNLL